MGIERGWKAPRLQQAHAAARNVLAQSGIEPVIVGQPLFVAKEPSQLHGCRHQQKSEQQLVAGRDGYWSLHVSEDR